MTTTPTPTNPANRAAFGQQSLRARFSAVHLDGADNANNEAARAWRAVAEQYPLLSRADELALLRRAHGLDGADTPEAQQAAVARLVECNLRLVLYVAARYLPGPDSAQSASLGLNELLSVGQEALLTAIKNFDVASGNAFATYAMWWLRQACGRERRVNHTIRVPAGTAEALATVERRGQVSKYQARYHSARQLAAAAVARDARHIPLDQPMRHGGPRDYRGETLGATLTDPASVADEGGVTDAAYAEQVASDDQAAWLLRIARRLLSAREFDVFIALTLEEPRPTRAELRARFGCSGEYVRLIYGRAVEKLHSYLRGDVRTARLAEGRARSRVKRTTTGRASHVRNGQGQHKRPHATTADKQSA